MGLLDFLKNCEIEQKEKIKIELASVTPIFTDSDVSILKLAVIVGHTKDKSGAKFQLANNSLGSTEIISEYAYNINIANLIKEHSIGKNIEVEIITRDEIGISAAYAKAKQCDLAIELHFNSEESGTVRGTETLCSTNVEDLFFANIIQDHVYKIFNSRNRGVKAILKTSRGGKSVWEMSGAPNCLIEPFFGSNELDAELGIKYQESYALSIVEAVLTYAKSKQIHLGKFT